MIIKKIEIKGFGKLKNFILNLDKGVQVIYGQNEAGKSTLMNFIKLMFYSRQREKSTRTSPEDKALREKFSPWSGEAMGGSIEFEHEGCLYKLQKTINKSSFSKDSVLLRNQTLGKIIELGKREEVGERIFSLDLSSFERSSYIKDFGKVGFDNVKISYDSILNKMINLAQTGDEEVCAVSVISRLDKALKELERPSGKSGKMWLLKSQIQSLKEELQSLEELEQSQSLLKDEEKSLKKLLAEKKILENKINSLEIKEKINLLSSILLEINKYQDFIKRYKNLESLEDLILTLESLKKEIEFLEIRLKEVQKNDNYLNCNFKNISNDIKELNSYLEKQKNLESQINNVSFLLNESKKNFKENTAFKELTSKKKLAPIVLILITFVSAGLAAKFSNVIITVFLALFGVMGCCFEIMKVINIRKETEKQTENLKNNLIHLNNELGLVKNNISTILKNRNASSLNDIYMIYEKSLDVAKNEEKIHKYKEDIERLKNKFISCVSKFKDTKNFESSLEFFYFLLNEKERAKEKKTEITSKLKIMGFENYDTQKIENEIKDLESKEKNLYEFENYNVGDLKNKLNEMKSLNLEDKYIAVKEKIKPPKRLIGEVLAEINEKSKMLENQTKYFKALKVAAELAQQASLEMRKNFNPKLNEYASDVFCSLTGEKYKNIYVEENYNIFVEHEFFQRECESLSSGTIDQAYLSLRIAISKLISSGKTPLILDDVLSRYDLLRTNNALNYFKNNQDFDQIILFTCHDSIAESSKENGINVIEI